MLFPSTGSGGNGSSDVTLGDSEALFPFDFYLIGTPVSLQGKPDSKNLWKETVKAAAEQRKKELVEWSYLVPQPLEIRIYYFPTAPMGGDIDNIVKPILDAMIGVIYVDDKTVERVVVQKIEPATVWQFSEPSEQLAAALEMASASEVPVPVVYLLVSNDLTWRRVG